MGRELILGIETSCDETAAAIVAEGKEILGNVVASQVDFHRQFRGVVPEIASRKHLEVVNFTVEKALAEAKVSLKELSAIAVTQGPGLIGALLVGVATAKALAYTKRLPLVGVNHLEGHIYANFLEHPLLKPPLVSLVVSGGHTSLIHMETQGKYQVLGETLDDAAGEAFDKIAGFLNLGYPGGPVIDEAAKQGNPEAIEFPRAMLKMKGYNFSLSGLKTAVLNYVSEMKAKRKPLNLEDLVASFQAAIIDVLVNKTFKAAQEKGLRQVVLAGGVAANSFLRKKFLEKAPKEGLKVYFPSLELCTDNAVMIAAAGYNRFKKGERLGLDAVPDPNLPLT